MLLEAGNIVPADVRLVDAAQMRMDEALLTGESVATDKTAKTLAHGALPLGDRRNIAYKGTIVAHGRGRGIVVATGMATELGRIATLLDEGVAPRTPLQQRLTRFGQRIGLAVLAICVIVFAAGLLRGEAPLLLFLTAISLAVAAIPEALPAVVTISLALGAAKMAKRHALDPPPARGRDAGLGHRHLLRQDRHADRQPDGRGGDLRRRRRHARLEGRGRRRCPGARCSRRSRFPTTPRAAAAGT